MAVETLIVVSAIREGQEQRVREALAPFKVEDDKDQDKSPFADVPGTHVARFVVMSSLGTGDPTTRKRLRPVRLLFSAVVDGPAEAWLWGLFEKQGDAFERVWEHCVGWPGRRDSTARARWLLEQRIPATYSVIAHQNTVAEIERGLALRNALRDVASEPANRTAAELRAAYRRAMARVSMSTLDLFDIQGNILRGYGMPYGCHLFVRIEDAALARAWLAESIGRVTTADLQARSELKVARNIAISAAGLEQLDVPPALRAEFSEEFRKGMARRSAEIGDEGASHPEVWKETAFRTSAAHLAVSLFAVSLERLRKEVRDVALEMEGCNLKVLHDRWVERQRQDREHFGFADGFAQPRVAGAPPGRRPIPTSPVGRPLPAGEFLLGYRDLDGALPAGPSGALGRNGTYMVYRELDQDVAGFRRFLDQQRRDRGLSEELLAAKIVGRWRNGTPLVVSPDDDGLRKGRADARLDDFGYADDRHGFRCPLGAHIRRANPRDDAGLDLAVTRRHRMIRRGMPYGPRLADGTFHDDGKERGLAFICFVADIERQFEFVQGQWCNDGNAFGLGSEADFLLGAGDRGERMTIQGTPPVFLRRGADQPGGLAPFVTTRGGEYFFVPGIAGLRSLAQGTIYG